jgi:DNA-binding MarR family transcriptional regulator
MKGKREKKAKPAAPAALSAGTPTGREHPMKLPLTLRGIVLFTRYVRSNLTLDFPMNQAAVLVAVFANRDAGATYQDIGEFLGGMSLSSISKNVARLSRYTVRGRVAGHGLLRSEPDIANRKRSRVFLTERGRELVHTLDACLTGEFSMPTDLPREIPGEAYAPEKGETR